MSYHYDAPSLGSSHVLGVKFVTSNYRNESFYLIVKLPIELYFEARESFLLSNFL